MPTKRGAYYNEIEPYAAQWLRNLIAAGHIAPGDVDERSITDVAPADLAGYTQCHFFAGIGVWSYALRLAGWPDNEPVWTGSCPCQPFSSAGRGDGAADPRHLWPAWFQLIRECRPGVCFGEQVASADGLAWLDLVYTNLEAEGYAIGAADICAAGFGAPHIRQRIYFVGQSDIPISKQFTRERSRPDETQIRKSRSKSNGSGNSRGVADAEHAERWPEYDSIRQAHLGDGPRRRGDSSVILGDASKPGLARRAGKSGDDGAQQPAIERAGNGPTNGFWSDAEWLPCRDGKARATKPGLFPLAHGVAGRVGRLRAYGNALVPQVAAAFVRSFLEAVTALPV